MQPDEAFGDVASRYVEVVTACLLVELNVDGADRKGAQRLTAELAAGMAGDADWAHCAIVAATSMVLTLLMEASDSIRTPLEILQRLAPLIIGAEREAL